MSSLSDEWSAVCFEFHYFDFVYDICVPNLSVSELRVLEPQPFKSTRHGNAIAIDIFIE